MTAHSHDASDLLVADAEVELEEIAERESLEELCQSIHTLFGIGVRVYAASGGLLASASSELEACVYVNTFGHGSAACGNTVMPTPNFDFARGKDKERKSEYDKSRTDHSAASRRKGIKRAITRRPAHR